MAQIGDNAPRSAGRAFLIYNVLRLGLLAICLGIGWLATLRGVPLLIVALAVSGAISWFGLRPQRVAMGMAVEQQVERSRVRARFVDRTAAEDQYVDSVLAPDAGPTPAAPSQAESTQAQSAGQPGDPPSS